MQGLKNEKWAKSTSNYGISVPILLGTKFMEFDGDKTTEARLLVQCLPKLKNAKFMRVEWNPERIPANDVADASTMLSPGLYARIIAEGTATRFDAAVDIANLDIDDYIFHRRNIRYTRVECESGRTLYLGSTESACAMVIYDKQAELKAKNKMKPKWLKKLPDKWAKTRIELRLRPKSPVTVSQIPQLSNPFATLTISGYAGLAASDLMWSMFLDSVRFRTANAALLRIKNKGVRTQFATRIEKAEAHWWNPEAVWSAVPKRIEELLKPADMILAA